MKRFSALFLTCILMFSSVMPVFASEAEITETVDENYIDPDSLEMHDDVIDFDLPKIDPVMYYAYVNSDYYGTDINPYATMTMSLDDESAEQFDISLYSNVFDPDLTASENAFSEPDFENYVDGHCDPYNMFDPNYICFYYASTEDLPDFCSDCSTHSGKYDFCILNRNRCAYDAYQLLVQNDIFDMIKERYVNYYIFIDPLNTGSKLQYTITIAGVQSGQFEGYAYPAFVYQNENGGYGGKFTFGVHYPNTSMSQSTIDINKYNGTVSYKQASFNGTGGMAGGDTITILRSKLLMSSIDIYNGQYLDRTNSEVTAYGDLEMYAGSYVPLDPNSLDYVDPLTGVASDAFGDYTDKGLSSQIGVLKNVRFRISSIYDVDNTDVLENKYTFTWDNTYPEYDSNYYVKCYVNVVADRKTISGKDDKEYYSGLIPFDTVKYSDLQSVMYESKIQETSAYKDFMKTIEFSDAIHIGQNYTMSYDFYFRILRYDHNTDSYVYGQWTALTRNRANYDELEYGVTSGYTDAENKYVATDNQGVITPSVGSGITEEEADNNIVIEGTTTTPGFGGAGAGYNQNGDYYNNQFGSLFSLFGNLPQMMGAMFVFLPGDIIAIISFSIVICVALRIFGR